MSDAPVLHMVAWFVAALMTLSKNKAAWLLVLLFALIGSVEHIVRGSNYMVPVVCLGLGGFVRILIYLDRSRYKHLEEKAQMAVSEEPEPVPSR